MVHVDYKADGDRTPIVSLQDAIRLGSMFDEQSALSRVCVGSTC